MKPVEAILAAALLLGLAGCAAQQGCGQDCFDCCTVAGRIS